ncbi:unnamed protein product, partial [Anisakis simplex]|uniref:Small proline-rich protein 2H-like n=1 Tax=Anisakis simplex TaxID=6269 RepID=A0A0M3J7S1_ANISI
MDIQIHYDQPQQLPPAPDCYDCGQEPQEPCEPPCYEQPPCDYGCVEPQQPCGSGCVQPQQAPCYDSGCEQWSPSCCPQPYPYPEP